MHDSGASLLRVSILKRYATEIRLGDCVAGIKPYGPFESILGF